MARSPYIEAYRHQVAVGFSVYSDYFSRCVSFWVFVVFPFVGTTFSTSKS